MIYCKPASDQLSTQGGYESSGISFAIQSNSSSLSFVKLTIYNYSLIVKKDLLEFINIGNSGSFSNRTAEGAKEAYFF